MSRPSWTAEDVVAASDEWIWIPDGSREVRTDDYLVVVADAEDWLRLVSGTLTATAALTSGRLQVEGDLTVAMKLERWVLSTP